MCLCQMMLSIKPLANVISDHTCWIDNKNEKTVFNSGTSSHTEGIRHKQYYIIIRQLKQLFSLNYSILKIFLSLGYSDDLHKDSSHINELFTGKKNFFRENETFY